MFRDSGAEVSEDENENAAGSEEEGTILVEMILNTLRKTCSLLLLSPNTETKNVCHFVSLLDICLAQDCYGSHQKQLLQSWKHKLNSIWKGSSLNKKSKFKTKDVGSNDDKSSFPISYWNDIDHQDSNRDPNKKRLSLQTEEAKIRSSYQHRFSLPLYNARQGCKYSSDQAQQSSLLSSSKHFRAVTKSSSTPLSEDELDSRLENLCISVTENALN